MKLDIKVTDKDKNPIEIGDSVELFDWGTCKKSLGFVKIVWCASEGRISSDPCLVEDPYDFFTKALPNCRKVMDVLEQDYLNSIGADGVFHIETQMFVDKMELVFEYTRYEDNYYSPVVKLYNDNYAYINVQEMKTSKAWMDVTKIRVVDPDGWNREDFEKDFNETPIGFYAFLDKVARSTIKIDDIARYYLKKNDAMYKYNMEKSK
jgi:hypothetical protein